MKGKVTQEMLSRMVEARANGAIYKDIMAQFNISKNTAIQYLKHIKINESVSVEIWKQAEKKALDVLLSKGYTDIVNLNEICPNGYFDILAFKDKEKWLIDVTINEQKDLANKMTRLVDNYRCAILYFSHDLNNNRIVELVEI